MKRQKKTVTITSLGITGQIDGSVFVEGTGNVADSIAGVVEDDNIRSRHWRCRGRQEFVT